MFCRLSYRCKMLHLPSMWCSTTPLYSLVCGKLELANIEPTWYMCALTSDFVSHFVLWWWKFCSGRNVYMQFSSHQELTTMDQPGQPRRLPSEQVRVLCLIYILSFGSSRVFFPPSWPLPFALWEGCPASFFAQVLLAFSLHSLFFLFHVAGGLSLLWPSPGTAAQPNSLNYHSQPALSHHCGCAAPSVFPSWLCREDRHLPEVSWSAFLCLYSVLFLSLFLSFVFFPFYFCDGDGWF